MPAFLAYLLHFLESSAAHYRFLNKGYRLIDLRLNLMGYLETGTHFIMQAKKSCGYLPTEIIGDDLGGYYLFNQVGAWLGSTDPFVVYDVLFLSVVGLGLVFSVAGILLLFRSRNARALGIGIYSLLAFHCLFILDVHSFFYLALSLAPLLVALVRRCPERLLVGPVLLLALAAGFMNLVRGHSGTVLLLLLAGLLWWGLGERGIVWRRRVFLLLLLLFAFLPRYFLHSALDRRDIELARLGCAVNPEQRREHFVWHTLYVGLSYIYSPRFDIRWSDEHAYQKTNALIMDPEQYVFRFHVPRFHEENMKRLYGEVWKNDPLYALSVYGAKFLAVLQQCGFWLGLAFLGWRPRASYPRWLRSMIVPGFLLLAPPLVAWPFPIYSLGIVMWSALLAVFVWGLRLEETA